MYFVWVKQPYGAPMAQIWTELWFGKDGQKRVDCLQHTKLTEEDKKLGINTLKRLYPLNKDN